MSKSKKVYICVVSQHNIVELESCLNIMPDEVLLIISKGMQDKARRLEKVLKEALPKLKILTFPTLFDGGNIKSIKEWSDLYFVSFLKDNQNNEIIFNATGGTKAMGLVFEQYLEDYCSDFWLHYKDMNDRFIQVAKIQQKKWQLESNIELSHSITAKQAVEVYEDEFTFQKIEHDSNKIEFAQKIWDDLSEEKENALQHCFKFLKEIWSIQREREQHKNSRIELDLNEEEFKEFNKALLLSGFDFLNKLVTTIFPIQNEPLFGYSEVTKKPYLIGNKVNSRIGKIKKFIEGDWLEILVQNWLLEVGFKEEQILSSLELKYINKETKKPKKEIDLFVYHKAKSYLIEVKADADKMREVSKQILESGMTLGLGGKILFAGPVLARRKNFNEDIALFKIQGIRVCTDKQSLLNYLNNEKK